MSVIASKDKAEVRKNQPEKKPAKEKKAAEK